ncbi:hypothetical protein D3C76_1065250 [compost metagenome]
MAQRDVVHDEKQIQICDDLRLYPIKGNLHRSDARAGVVGSLQLCPQLTMVAVLLLLNWCFGLRIPSLAKCFLSVFDGPVNGVGDAVMTLHVYEKVPLVGKRDLLASTISAFVHEQVVLEPDFLSYLYCSTYRRWKDSFRQRVTTKRVARAVRPQHFLLVNIKEVWVAKRKLREHPFGCRQSMQRTAELCTVEPAYARALGRFTWDRQC